MISLFRVQQYLRRRALSIVKRCSALTIDCFGKASLMLDRLFSRVERGMATPKQMRQLERFGFQHPGTWTFDQASHVMTILSGHQWRVPRWLDPATYDPNKGAAFTY